MRFQGLVFLIFFLVKDSSGRYTAPAFILPRIRQDWPGISNYISKMCLMYIDFHKHAPKKKMLMKVVLKIITSYQGTLTYVWKHCIGGLVGFGPIFIGLCLYCLLSISNILIFNASENMEVLLLLL